MSERPLGEILAEVGRITRLQLAEALQIQKEERGRIGEVLVSLGYVTTRQVRHLIGEYKKRIPLGEYLLEAGVISPEDLDFALLQKSSSREPLGQILVKSQIIDEEQLAKFLSQQLDMPYTEPYKRLVDVGLFNRLPRVFMRHNMVLPLHKNNGVVTVVVSGLPDEHIMMQLAAVFGDDLDLTISTPTKILDTIKALLDNRSAPEHDFIAESEGEGAEASSRIDFSEASLENATGEFVAVEWLNYIINEGLREGASDIHIESMPEHVRIRFRVNGILTHKIDLPLAFRAGLFRRIKALAGMKFADSFRDQEGRLLGQTDKTNVDLRVSTFVGIHGETINLRLFAQEDGVMDINDLGITPNVYGMLRRALDHASGLVIVCGPPGSGKTTSMFGALNKINQRHLKVVTIEDPVEYHLPGVIQTQLSSHRGSTLAEVIESAVHQDPDVIVIGEISEDEEARVILRAALMGYKMLTTFHANDVLGALLRLGNTHLDTFMRSSTPFTIICQRLVRKVCDDCRAVIAPEPRYLAQFPIRDFDPTKYDFCHGVGCSSCHNTGYKGRTGIFEALTITEEIRQAYMRGSSALEFLKLARASSPFLTLGEIGALKAIRQITTVDEVVRVAPFSPYTRGDAEMLSFQEIEHISETPGIAD
jgi:type II secretory ATPase GspE/PulE/Tfp pilus assembly ATPase PilB-like protein